MIFGSFDERGRPLMEGRLVIQRLGVDHWMDFLLDTGAERTCLHSRDVARARVPVDLLGEALQSRGVGGTSTYFMEPALLSFDDQFYTRVYRVELLIAAPGETSAALPSLLGRDVINYWNVNYDPTNGALGCLVRHADYTLPVN